MPGSTGRSGLVYQDDQGDVWVAYTDFAWIAKREIFEDGNIGTGRYEDAVVSLAGR